MKIHKVQTRILLAIIASFVIIILLMGFIINNAANQRVVNTAQIKGKSFMKSLYREIEFTSEKASLLAVEYANLPTVKKAYTFDDDLEGRNYLRNKLASKIKNLKEQSGLNNDFRLHFHKSPAKSFWRIWREEGNGAGGDNLSGFRKTILKVKETNQKVEGIEVGKAGLVIRGIVPINNDSSYIGSVETFYSFNSILSKFKTDKDESFYVFLNKESAKIAWKLKDNKTIGNFTFVTKSKTAKSTNFCKEKLLDSGFKDYAFKLFEGYGISTFPIKDFNGKNIGVICYVFDANEEIAEVATVKLKVTMALVILLVFLFLVIYIIIRKEINKPLKIIIKELGKISKGYIDEKIEIRSKTEFGLLANNINETFHKFSNVLKKVSKTSENNKMSGVELNRTSQEVSEGASEQAASVEEVSASMEEMSANIEQSVENAEKTEKEVYLAAAAVFEGNKSVQKTAKLMQDIDEKISIINEIAKQTNILALNASVEAASAGEFGKGFAVIAREIRELAETSAHSALSIQESINSGVAFSEKASGQLTDIVKKMENTSEMVKLIVVAGKEQKLGIVQVLNGIEQLNRITQQNAAVAEQMAVSSEKLVDQSTELEKSVEFFIFEEEKKSKKEKRIVKEENTTKPKAFDEISSNEENTNISNDIEKTGAAGYNLELGNTSDDEFELF